MGNSAPAVTGESILAGFQAAPSGTAQQQHLVKLTKYEKARDGLNPSAPQRVKLAEDLDVVAVFDPQTETAALIERKFLGRTELDQGRSFTKYEVTRYLVVGKGPQSAVEALDLIAVMDAEQVSEVVSGIDGW